MRPISKIAAVSALALLSACTSVSDTSKTSAAFGQAISVLDIIDGDTIKIQDQRSGAISDARLVGYDTPEIFEPGCAEELALGQKATQRLQVLLARARDISTAPLGTDRFGRQLLRVNLDGRDLASIMVSEGLAVPYDGGRRINWCRRLAAT